MLTKVGLYSFWQTVKNFGIWVLNATPKFPDAENILNNFIPFQTPSPGCSPAGLSREDFSSDFSPLSSLANNNDYEMQVKHT